MQSLWHYWRYFLSSRKDAILIQARKEFVHNAVKIKRVDTVRIAEAMNKDRQMVCYYLKKPSPETDALLLSFNDSGENDNLRWKEIIIMKTQKQKTEEKLHTALNNILDNLVGGDLTFDEMVNEIFIRVILEMKIVGNYEVERIFNDFKKSLYEAVQREYSMNHDEVVKIINE